MIYPLFYRRDKNKYSVFLSEKDALEITRFPGPNESTRIIRTKNPFMMADVIMYEKQISKAEFVEFYNEVKSQFDISEILQDHGSKE